MKKALGLMLLALVLSGCVVKELNEVMDPGSGSNPQEVACQVLPDDPRCAESNRITGDVIASQPTTSIEVVGQVTEESEEPATQPTVGPGVVEVIGTPTLEPTQALAGRITVLEPENGSALFYPNYDFTFRVEGVSTGEYGIWIAGIGESMSTITAFPPCIPGATEVCRADGDVVYYHSSIYWGLCGRHPNGSLICEETFGLDEVYHLTAHLLWLDPNCTEWIQEYREDRFNFRGGCTIRLDEADIVLGSED